MSPLFGSLALEIRINVLKYIEILQKLHPGRFRDSGPAHLRFQLSAVDSNGDVCFTNNSLESLVHLEDTSNIEHTLEIKWAQNWALLLEIIELHGNQFSLFTNELLCVTNCFTGESFALDRRLRDFNKREINIIGSYAYYPNYESYPYLCYACLRAPSTIRDIMKNALDVLTEAKNDSEIRLYTELILQLSRFLDFAKIHSVFSNFHKHFGNAFEMPVTRKYILKNDAIKASDMIPTYALFQITNELLGPMLSPITKAIPMSQSLVMKFFIIFTKTIKQIIHENSKKSADNNTESSQSHDNSDNHTIQLIQEAKFTSSEESSNHGKSGNITSTYGGIVTQDDTDDIEYISLRLGVYFILCIALFQLQHGIISGKALDSLNIDNEEFKLIRDAFFNLDDDLDSHISADLLDVLFKDLGLMDLSQEELEATQSKLQDLGFIDFQRFLSWWCSENDDDDDVDDE